MKNYKKRVYNLDHIAKLSAGGDRPKVFSKNKTKDLQVPVYSNGIVDKGLYGYTNIPKINGNSITISSRGTIGAVYFRKDDYVPIVRLISVEPNNKIVDEKYLYYYLLNSKIEGYGTTQQQLTLPYMSKFQVEIFDSILIQKKVAHILNSIDDKIELNNKINKNLAA